MIFPFGIRRYLVALVMSGAAPEADRRSADEGHREDPGCACASGAAGLRGGKLTGSNPAPSSRDQWQPAHLLDGVPPARLFDECLKLFLSGFGAKSFACSSNIIFLSTCFRYPPPRSKCRRTPMRWIAFERGLANTDARIVEDKNRHPDVFVRRVAMGSGSGELNDQQAGSRPSDPRSSVACDTVLKAQQTRVAIPRRFAIPMRELLMLQPRFNRRSGLKSLSLLQHPRFRAAYDFPYCCAPKREWPTPELAQWWTDIQVLPHEQRVALVQARPAEPVTEGSGAAPSRRRRRRRRGGAARS